MVSQLDQAEEMVPFNDVRRRFLSVQDALSGDFAAVVRSGNYIGGPFLEAFERKFAEYNGAKYCVGVANGTDALELALRACGIQPGDNVVTVPNAGGYTTTACHAIGAVPIFADVNPETCQIDLDSLERSLSSETKALVVTHLYGLMNDVAAIKSRLSLAGRHSVLIIEDCAQAHGALMHGARAGSLGDAAAFSFYPTKNMGGIGDAGAVLSSNLEIAKRARQFSQYGWQSKYVVANPGGRNSRMDPLQAVVLSAQIGNLDEANRARRNICAIYRDNLPSDWSIVYEPGLHFVAHLAVVQAPNIAERSRAIALLTDRGIGCGIHFPVLDCDQPGWQNLFPPPGDLSVSRKLKDVILSLPCFPEMTSDEIDEVVDALRALS